MKLSTRSRYGARLLLDLARKYNSGPVHLKDVAEQEEVPIKYLEQIIIPLKEQGFIKSVQGPKGGYLLARPPEEISFGQIVRALEKNPALAECVDHPEVCKRSVGCPTRGVWLRASQAMHKELEAVSLADELCAQPGQTVSKE